MKKSAFIMALFLSSFCFSQQMGKIADLRVAKAYWTVTLGGVEWMAENINYKTSGSYCLFDDENNCNNLGRLYTVKAAAEACPEKWHAATWDDWVELQKTINDMFSDDKNLVYYDSISGESGVVWAKPLLYSGWMPNPDGERTMISPFLSFYNQSNFSAIPAGIRSNGEYYPDIRKVYFWMMGENPVVDHPIIVRLSENKQIFGDRIDIVTEGLEDVAASVRCVKSAPSSGANDPKMNDKFSRDVD